MDFSFLNDDLGYLLWGTFPDGPPGGALLTLLLSAGSGLASAALGLGLGLLLVLLRGPALLVLTLLLGFLRAIPVLMLIFWSYFLLPIVFGLDVPGVLSVMAALALVSGAYLAHAVAAGIRGVGAGQMAAALSLGFTRWGALRQVVLPQALRMMLPSFINQWVTLVKDSSLAYIVGVSELSFLATQVNARVMVHPTEIFLFVGAVYWLLCSALDLGARAVARRHAHATTPAPTSLATASR
ncbi:MAG: amino acid ABC transporter permease [Comamonas sp.]